MGGDSTKTGAWAVGAMTLIGRNAFLAFFRPFCGFFDVIFAILRYSEIDVQCICIGVLFLQFEIVYLGTCIIVLLQNVLPLRLMNLCTFSLILLSRRSEHRRRTRLVHVVVQYSSCLEYSESNALSKRLYLICM